ncbi:MAG TPA: DNA polymerase I [Bacteroidales bacterium]|nr:DNA polymerase I [Bacteroidales bacterium]
MPENKLFLLDAMALIYRAFYAMAKTPRINSKGMNTGAILGFANTLWDVLKNEDPTHIGVAFDMQAPTMRHEDFAEYKANRQAMPEDLAASIPWIKDLIRAFNIPILEKEGYEADDLLGTLALQAAQKGFKVYIMSTDKDLGQLVSENILLYRPARFGNESEILGVEEICQKYGIKNPAQLTDILGLWGDASDNIPGVPGIGETYAKKLIAQFDTIENLIQNAEKIENPKIKEKILAHAEEALFSKQLASLRLDAPVEFDEELFKRHPPDIESLRKILDTLEFRTFSQRIFKDLEKKKPSEQLSFFPLEKNEEGTSLTDSLKNIHNTPHHYSVLSSIEEIRSLAYTLQYTKEFCFDTETTGLDPNNCDLVGISFAVLAHEAWYIPLPQNRDKTIEILEILKPPLQNSDILKIGQNMKFDLTVLHWYGCQPSAPFFDTMLAHYVIEPEQRHSMDYLARAYLHYDPVPIESLIGKKGNHQGNMRGVEIEKIKEYAAEDADITLQLKYAIEPLLHQTGTYELFQEIEMPLMPVLVSMETQGVKIDTEALNAFGEQLENEIHQIAEEIYSLAGESFNISSPKQLGVILFEKLKIAENPRLTSTKQYATGEDVLEKLAHRHPIVEKILDYRELTKLKSTYVDTLPQMINPRTQRVHTSYNQAVTATGRLSSNNPNLQNIPVRTERGREIRKAFIPRNSDYILISADYSQIELRIIAHLSGDEAMKEAFRQGLDIHAATASRIFNIPLNQVTKEQRRTAKSVNFGIVYGISAYGLAQNLDIPKKEAAAIIEEYFKQYPGIKAYMEKSIVFAREHGYVETIKGRKRYLPDINSANANMRGFAERNAINAPIQGSAADMIKIAMINIYQALKEKFPHSYMILQVHDELVFDARKEEAEEIKIMVRNIMQNAMPLSIPVVVDINAGENWLEAH